MRVHSHSSVIYSQRRVDRLIMWCEFLWIISNTFSFWHLYNTVFSGVAVCVIVQSIGLVKQIRTIPHALNSTHIYCKQYWAVESKWKITFQDKLQSTSHCRGKTIGEAHNRWDRTLYWEPDQWSNDLISWQAFLTPNRGMVWPMIAYHT